MMPKKDRAKFHFTQRGRDGARAAASQLGVGARWRATVRIRSPKGLVGRYRAASSYLIAVPRLSGGQVAARQS